MVQLNKRKSNDNVLFIDSKDPFSCYGRYANDPIIEKHVNSKIKWSNEFEIAVLKVPKDVFISKGDEIYASYGGLSYWEEKVDSIHESLRDYL